MNDLAEQNDLLTYVPNVTFEQIPIKNLVSNQQYQRNLSVGHVKRVAANFNLYQINPVKVSRRNGVNYVFNGQHTIETVALVSDSRDTPVWCMVYDDIDYEDEADIFANQMRFTKPLTPYEIFMANIEAGNDKQLIIKDLVESFHLTIGGSRLPNCICAISALEHIHDKFGFHVLERALRLCVGAWEGDLNSLCGNIIRGISRIIVAYGGVLKDDQFVDKLGRVSPKEIIRRAKDRRDGSAGYAEAMLLYYNQRMKIPLKMEKLYSQTEDTDVDSPSSTLIDFMDLPQEDDTTG
jgi:hypothetical protein